MWAKNMLRLFAVQGHLDYLKMINIFIISKLLPLKSYDLFGIGETGRNEIRWTVSLTELNKYLKPNLKNYNTI